MNDLECMIIYFGYNKLIIKYYYFIGNKIYIKNVYIYVYV